MPEEGPGNLNNEDRKFLNSETRIGSHDTEQARHFAAHHELYEPNIKLRAARFPATQEVPILENGHGEDMYLISPAGATFGEGLDPMDEQRQGLAGQVVQVPRTPNRGSPNIGRKRSQNPALLRAAVTPGHSAKMAQIFHHAQITLRNDLQPSGSTPGMHSKKSRLPVLQRRAAGRSMACDVEGDNVGQAIAAAECTSGTMATTMNGQNKQHISLGDAKTPSKAIANESYSKERNPPSFLTSNSSHRRGLKGPTGGNSGMEPKERSVSDNELVVSNGSTRGRVVTNESTPPELGTMARGFDIWDDEDDSELYYARRSVALPTPMASKEVFSPGTDKSIVDKWLEDMLSASPRRKWRVPAIPGLDGDLRSHFPTMKEDQGMTRSISQARETIRQQQQHVSDGETGPPETDVKSEDSDKENQNPSDKRIATTPHKSRIPTLGEKLLEEQTSTAAAAESPFRFTHHATPRGYFLETPKRRKQASKGVVAVPLPEIEEVVKLSPDVDPYRKANRPRRNRCASYYDEDILTSPGKKDVLTESNMSRKLTRAMAFCEEAEDYEFTGVKTRE